MGTKTKNRIAPAFTSSDALLFDYIRKVELRLTRLEHHWPNEARAAQAKLRLGTAAYHVC